MGLYWAVPRVNVSLAILINWTVDICPNPEPTRGSSANENFTHGKSPLVRTVNGFSDPKNGPDRLTTVNGVPLRWMPHVAHP